MFRVLRDFRCGGKFLQTSKGNYNFWQPSGTKILSYFVFWDLKPSMEENRVAGCGGQLKDRFIRLLGRCLKLLRFHLKQCNWRAYSGILEDIGVAPGCDWQQRDKFGQGACLQPTFQYQYWKGNFENICILTKISFCNWKNLISRKGFCMSNNIPQQQEANFFFKYQ